MTSPWLKITIRELGARNGENIKRGPEEGSSDTEAPLEETLVIVCI